MVGLIRVVNGGEHQRQADFVEHVRQVAVRVSADARDHDWASLLRDRKGNAVIEVLPVGAVLSLPADALAAVRPLRRIRPADRAAGDRQLPTVRRLLAGACGAFRRPRRVRRIILQGRRIVEIPDPHATTPKLRANRARSAR